MGLRQAAAPVIHLYRAHTHVVTRGPEGTTIPIFLPLPAVLFSEPLSCEHKAPVHLPQLCAEEAAWPSPSPRMHQAATVLWGQRWRRPH